MGITKNLKYVIVAGLVAALVFAPATKAFASVTSEMERVKEETEAFVAEATSAEHQTVAGVKSQVGGFYTAKEVSGVALAPAAGISSTGSFVKVTDTDKKKSTAAVDTATTSCTNGTSK